MIVMAALVLGVGVLALLVVRRMMADLRPQSRSGVQDSEE